MEKDMNSICCSGGAKGADQLFEKLAASHGHEVRSYTFGDRDKDNPNRIALSDSELRQADPHLKKANIINRRRFPARWESTNNLLRRDWWQVKDADRVYAVARAGVESVSLFDTEFVGHVEGGTAWAVAMAAHEAIPIYFFDLQQEMWMRVFARYRMSVGHLILTFHYALKDEVPRPTGIYAGIGSRHLTDAGERAIYELYTLEK